MFLRSVPATFKEVFKRLQEANVTVKLKKYRFGVSECTYLGHAWDVEEYFHESQTLNLYNTTDGMTMEV